MTLRAPSFLAAVTSASIPPRSAADVAVAALLPPGAVVVSELFVGAEQALTTSADVATSASIPVDRRIRTECMRFPPSDECPKRAVSNTRGNAGPVGRTWPAFTWCARRCHYRRPSPGDIVSGCRVRAAAHSPARRLRVYTPGGDGRQARRVRDDGREVGAMCGEPPSHTTDES